MTVPRKDLGLADMRDMPMSAAWYWLLSYHRSTLRLLLTQHRVAVKGCKQRDPAIVEQDEVAQRLGQACMEQLDRYLRTMEAAGALGMGRDD